MAESSTYKTEKIPSNEEVIDELTKGLEKSCVSPEECAEKEALKEATGDTEGSDEGSKEQERCQDDDYIDELELKDKEVTYTQEDRERLQKDAEAFKNEGNELFKAGNYTEAALKYTAALRTCPLAYEKDRAVLFGNRGACKVKLELNETAIEDCTKSIELDPNYVKVLIRRAQLYEKVEKLDEALEDYKKVVTLDPSQKEAGFAVQRLPHQIHERNEKLKTEMMGKLKDLGNMILKPFGLSTNNFEMVQDPNSGGYSISFKQS